MSISEISSHFADAFYLPEMMAQLNLNIRKSRYENGCCSYSYIL